MNKVTIRLVLFVAVFLGAFALVREVDWLTVFNVEQNSQTLEKKLGELYMEFLNATEDTISDAHIIAPVDTLLTQLCKANHIDRSQIKLHIINDPLVNAFTLPDQHVLVNTGLIKEAENEHELAGVLSHELAHIELDHVMKKLIKEVGLSILISMTTGSNGGDVVKESLKVLSSTAYDRTLEEEADLTAVDFMIEAKMNPTGLADFMYKLSISESDLLSYLSWLSTHPASEDRAKYIVAYIDDQDWHSNNVLSDSTWMQLQSSVKTLEDF